MKPLLKAQPGKTAETLTFLSRCGQPLAVPLQMKGSSKAAPKLQIGAAAAKRCDGCQCDQGPIKAQEAEEMIKANGLHFLYAKAGVSGSVFVEGRLMTSMQNPGVPLSFSSVLSTE